MRPLFGLRRESLAETRAPSSRRRVLQEPDRAVVSSRSSCIQRETLPPASCHPPPALPPGAVRRLDTATRPLVWSSTRQTRHRVYGRAERHAVTHDELYRLLLGPVPRLTRPHAMSSAAGQPKVSRDSTPTHSSSTRAPSLARRVYRQHSKSTTRLEPRPVPLQRSTSC